MCEQSGKLAAKRPGLPLSPVACFALSSALPPVSAERKETLHENPENWKLLKLRGDDLHFQRTEIRSETEAVPASSRAGVLGCLLRALLACSGGL